MKGAMYMINSLILKGVISLFDESGSIFKLASSKYAIIAYMILLFIIIAVLVIFLLINDTKGNNTKAANVVFENPTFANTQTVAPTPQPTEEKGRKGKKEKKAAKEEVREPLVQEAEKEIKAELTEEEENERAPRFCMLSRIDENKRSYEARRFEEEASLKRFCDNFRNYAAAELRLYYDIKDIRRFIAGMAVSPIIILQGMSGTGKTSLAHAMGSFVRNTSTVIPVQPMWKERTDLLGYYNEFTKRFNETLLLEKMYEANYCKDIYITVLDEMNIARVEYYFAEFLSLLELPNPDERYIDVVSDVWESDPVQLKDGRIKLPTNMWFIGTANNDDSTFAISDKVYDRAMILNLDEKSERFVAPRTKPTPITAENFKRLTVEAMQEYELTGRK